MSAADGVGQTPLGPISGLKCRRKRDAAAAVPESRAETSVRFLAFARVKERRFTGIERPPR